MRSSGSLLCVCDVHGEREEGLCGFVCLECCGYKNGRMGEFQKGRVPIRIEVDLLEVTSSSDVPLPLSYTLSIQAMGLLLVVNCRSRRGRESMKGFAEIRVGLRKSCWRSMRRREDIVLMEGSRDREASGYVYE